jgi:hypothetical protein
MRFYEKPKVNIVGNIRVVYKFLLLPIKIGLETRWLENARYVERLHKIEYDDIFGCFPEYKWIPEQWLGDIKDDNRNLA